MMPTHLQHICVLTQCMGVLEWRKEVMIGMKHYGDITKMDGYSIPPVDVITGGSPC